MKKAVITKVWEEVVAKRNLSIQRAF